MSVIENTSGKSAFSFSGLGFEYSPDIILVIDKEKLSITDANLTALQIFGYKKNEFLSLTLDDISAAGTNRLLTGAIEKAVFTQNIQTIKTAFLKKNNAVFWAEVKLQIAEMHEKTLIVASLREQEPAQMAQSEKAHQITLLSFISDAIISTDMDFNIISWNKPAEKLFGWSRKEAAGKNIDEIVNITYFNTDVTESKYELFENGSWTGEVIHHKKSGEPFPASVSVSVIKDENENDNGIVAVIRDISKQKQDEKKIEYLAKMVDKVTDAIISIDKNLKIKSWNNGAENMYGFSEKELNGISLFNLFDPTNTTTQVENIINEINKNGSWTGEATHFTKRGKKIYVIISASPLLYGKDGIITEYVLIIKNISERKLLEDQLKALNTELDQRVKEKTAELTDVFERITEAFIAIDTNWRCTYINKRGGEIFNRDPKTIVGKNIWEEFPENVGRPFYFSYHEAMETQQFIRLEEYYVPTKQWLEGLIYPSPKGLSIYLKNITDRKNAEEKLIASEKLFKALIENSADGLALLSDKGVIMDASFSAEKITGLKKEELVGLSCHKLVKPEDVPKIDAVFEEIKKHPSVPKTIEYEIKSPDGSTRNLESTYNNLLDEAYVNAIVLNFRDITERKKAENELKKSEARYRTAQSQGKIGHWEYNLKDLSLFWSDEVYKIFDVDPKQHQADMSLLLSKIHPEDFAAFIKEEQEVCNSIKKMNFTHRIILNNGAITHVHTIAELVKDKDGQALKLAGMIQDVTEQKIAENKLIESEEKYRLLFDSSPMPMWIFELETHRFMEVNKAAIDLYGYSREEFFSGTVYNIMPDEINGYEEARNMPAAFQQKGNQNYFFHKKKNNEIITVEIISNEIEFKNTRAKLVLITNRTEQAKTELSLLETTKQLREFASHLQNIREEERTAIAREIHDELGQQLTGLKMDLSWLSKKLESSCEIIQNKMKGSLSLIDGTITTVRKIAAELRPGILDDLGLAEAIEWHIGEFEKRSGIEVEFTSDVYDVKLPPNITIGFYRIFQEALTNVARHAKATHLRCKLQREAGNLYLSVSDNGIGYDTTMQQNSKTLGLLGMKERITLLNGHYRIESDGRGTTIEVKIPLPPIPY